MKGPNLHIYVGNKPGLKAALQAIASSEGVSVSTLVRRVLLRLVRARLTETRRK